MGYVSPTHGMNPKQLAKFWRQYKAAREREKMMAQRRAKAARAVARAVRLWILPPAHYWICFDCNKQAECYDHRDYRKPLDVWPVCNVCDAKRGAADPYDGGESYWNARRLATKKRLGIK